MIEPVIWTNIILGVVQGLTEFLPVSSSGHLILARELFGFSGEMDLTFDALLHFATASAIVVYFRKDIYSLLKALFNLPLKVFKKVDLDTTDNMVIALMVGTIPAVIFGLLLEDLMESVFRNPMLIAYTLLVGSAVMFFAEKKKGIFPNMPLGWKKGLILGLFQSLALIPGMSRSGMTISGGMLTGMSRAKSARFGFLLGIPILLGAGAKKALELGLGEIDILGVASAFVVGLLVIHFLLKFLRSHTLYVFIFYRVVLAVGILIVL